MRVFAKAALLLCVLGLSACRIEIIEDGHDADVLADATAGVEAGNQQMIDCVAKQDAKACGDIFTEDAVYLSPFMAAIEGNDAIGAAWGAEMEAGMASLELNTIEIDAFPGTAIERGDYVVNGPEGEHLDHGKYIVIWKKTDDGWKAHRDIYNSDMPAP